MVKNCYVQNKIYIFVDAQETFELHCHCLSNCICKTTRKPVNPRWLLPLQITIIPREKKMRISLSTFNNNFHCKLQSFPIKKYFFFSTTACLSRTLCPTSLPCWWVIPVVRADPPRGRPRPRPAYRELTWGYQHHTRGTSRPNLGTSTGNSSRKALARAPAS